MKSLSAHIKDTIKHIAFVAATLCITACGPILDNDYGDCTVRYHVCFKYDYNMLGVDAFSKQVECVTLYAFDADGVLCHQISETKENILANNNRMTIPFCPEEYHLVSWGHNINCQTTELPALTCGSSTLNDLKCRIGGRSEADNCTQVCEIGPIFHGEAICPTPENEDELNPIYMMPMMKNTNNVRIILQNQSNEPLYVEKFDFTIVEENGLMNFDNSLLPDEQLTYIPFYTGSGQVEYEEEEEENPTRAQESLNVAIAEFTFGRIMADRKPRLTVTNKETGKKVFSIPLTDYLKIARSQYVENMSDQEYLDREDAYALTFILDKQGNWMSSHIFINSWRVVLMEVEF